MKSQNITLALNEDERLLSESANSFLAERAPVTAFRKLRDGKDPNGYSKELWKEMADLGWTGILVPEAYGGADLGHAGAAILCEHMGRTLVASPFIATAVVLATALRHYGSPAQKDRLLPKIAAGDVIAALAIDEGPKHAPHSIKLRAEPAGKGWTLSGAKVFVEDGHVADVLIVAARVDNGFGLFLVDAKRQGISIERKSMVDSRNSATVTFNKVAVTQDDLLGQPAHAALYDHVLDAARAALAAELSGCAQQTFAVTLEYMAQRKQFGVPIASFQALQFRAATLFTEVELAKSTALAAARKLDNGDADAPAFVSVAKAKAGSVATLAGAEGVQLHGGMGMTDEMDVGLYMKRIRVAQERYGDVSFHTDRLSRLHNY